MPSAFVALLAASASSGLEFQEERVEWSRPQVTGEVPQPREGHCAHVVQQSLFIYGGSSSDLHMDMHDMHVLDLANMNWAAVDTCADNDATCYVPPKAARRVKRVAAGAQHLPDHLGAARATQEGARVGGRHAEQRRFCGGGGIGRVARG